MTLPAPGVVLAFSRGGVVRKTRTDQKGGYRIGLPAGVYSVTTSLRLFGGRLDPQGSAFAPATGTRSCSRSTPASAERTAQSSIAGAAPYSSSVTWSPQTALFPVVVDLEHRHVGHEPRRRRAVPVLLAGLEEDAVARTDDLDRPTATLSVTDSLGDPDRLAVRVGVPGSAGAGREVDVAGAGAASRPTAPRRGSSKTVPVNQSLGPATVARLFLVICMDLLLG